ncbi:hypothetical protein L1887_36263 [Cichorium endivia]|nr:hypothetical protein L1887_36263 [Cichorium endivia]
MWMQGQTQLKLGDYKSSLSKFEEVLEVYPENCETLKVVAYIYIQLNQTTKAHNALKNVAIIDPRDTNFMR